MPRSSTRINRSASIVVKSILGLVKRRLGRKIRSSALLADGWNDTVDILSGSTALVALGLTLYDPVKFVAADHLGGAAVGIIVIFLGVRVVRDRRFPPFGAWLIVDTVILEGIEAHRRGRMLKGLAIALAVTSTLLAVLFWRLIVLTTPPR